MSRLHSLCFLGSSKTTKPLNLPLLLLSSRMPGLMFTSQSWGLRSTDCIAGSVLGALQRHTSSSQQSYVVGTITIPIFQMRKLKPVEAENLSEIRQLVERAELNPSCLAPKPGTLTTTPQASLGIRRQETHIFPSTSLFSLVTGDLGFSGDENGEEQRLCFHSGF